MRPDGPRDPVAGADSGPEAPFPISLSGPIVKGFGRGSKELGIPTANIPPTGLGADPASLSTGVYYGYVSLPISKQTSRPVIIPIDTANTASEPETKTETETAEATSTPPDYTPTSFPAVLSLGYNPFYANRTISLEIHILHKFEQDFYGAPLNLLILGYIRPELDYISKEALIEDIMTDCDVALKSLERTPYAAYAKDGEEKATWVKEFGWVAEKYSWGSNS